MPSHKLEVAPFALNIKNVEPEHYFKRVTDLKITQDNGFVVVDIDGPGVLRFDSDGNFINNIAGYGSGNYEALCSATPVDSLIAINTFGLIEFFTDKGRPVKRYFMRGRGDVFFASNGDYVINRMYDSFRFGHCLETYDARGKLIKQFRSPRASGEKDGILDFAFSGIADNNKIFYLPAVVDSGFIYDLNGNLILAKKIKSKLKPYKLKNGKQGPLIEDAFVSDEGIFVVRVNKKMSKEEIVYFDLIEQYDFNFELVASFHLADPLTMSTPTDPYSPWYHKFCYKNSMFYFIISHPYEQFIAFKVKK
ncbi:MAG: hypothetical protein GXO74_01295 [Calditrichaeota bacterium]|nr:hypothetical protein [Calditrichota bacterium]